MNDGAWEVHEGCMGGAREINDGAWEVHEGCMGSA